MERERERAESRRLTIRHQHTPFRESLISQPDRIRMDVNPINDDSPERSLELGSDLRAHDLISNNHDFLDHLVLFLLVRFRRLSGRERRLVGVVDDDGGGRGGGFERSEGGREIFRRGWTGDEFGDGVGKEFSD